MIQHLPAVLIIARTLAIWAFYAMFAVAGLVLAINSMLELLYRLLNRIIGRGAMTSEFPLSWPPGFPHIEYPAQSRFDTPEERVRRIWSSRYLMDAMNVVVSTKLRAAPPRPAVFQPEHHGLGCGGLFHTERPRAGHRLRQMGLYLRQPPSRSQDHRNLRGIKRWGTE